MEMSFVPSRYFAKDLRSGDFFFVAKKVAKRLTGVFQKRDFFFVHQNLKRRPSICFWHIYSVQFQMRDKRYLPCIFGKMKVGDCVIFERCSGDAGPYGIDPEGFCRLKGPMRPFDWNFSSEIRIRVYTCGFPPKDLNPSPIQDDDDIEEDVEGSESNKRMSKNGTNYSDNNSVSLSNSESNWCSRSHFPAPDLEGFDPASMTVYWEQEIKNGEACCLPLFDMRRTPGPCNKILSETVDTPAYVRLNVTYAIFDDGAECFLTLKLLNFKGTDCPYVYGQIITSNALFKGDDRAKSLVFDRKRDERQFVRAGHYIRLHRPVNVAPVGDELNVQVKLWHSPRNSDTISVLADGTCSFRAKCTYKNRASWPRSDHAIVDSRIISGPLGTVELKAYWLPCWCFPYYEYYT